MSKLANIVAATDFSEASRQAVQLAAVLAQNCQATLHLCFVNETAGAVGLYPSFRTTTRGPFAMSSERQLETLGRDLLAGQDRDVTSGVINAPHAATGILSFAEERAAELIVVGTRGRGLWRRAFLGSVALEVVDHSRQPVLVVPLPSHGEVLKTDGKSSLAQVGNGVAQVNQGPVTDGCVLAAVDLSTVSVSVLEYARDVADALGKEVEIAFVAPQPALGKKLTPQPSRVWVDRIEAALGSEAAIDRSSVRVLQGEVGEELVALARRRSASFLVLGHRQRDRSQGKNGGWDEAESFQTRHRSVVRTAFSRTPCPILVVPGSA